MSFMPWRKLFNRLERPKDRRKGRHCAENLAIANREYLKKAAENSAWGGLFSATFFHRHPQHVSIAALMI
jgi:hypothetical protein